MNEYQARYSSPSKQLQCCNVYFILLFDEIFICLPEVSQRRVPVEPLLRFLLKRRHNRPLVRSEMRASVTFLRDFIYIQISLVPGIELIIWMRIICEEVPPKDPRRSPASRIEPARILSTSCCANPSCPSKSASPLTLTDLSPPTSLHSFLEVPGIPAAKCRLGLVHTVERCNRISSR